MSFMFPLGILADDSSEEAKRAKHNAYVDGNVGQAAATVTGELKKWHPITVSLEGPQASETGSPNPFLNYRFDVIFSQAELSIRVPGYFAADGNAAETSSTSGNIWRAHFIPPRTGNWTYRTSFRQGSDVAISTDANAGSAVAGYDDVFGSFTIAETDKSGPDFRGKGKLRYVGEHYLQFDNGEYFVKGGTDSPENLLAYQDFDGTYNNGGVNFIKSYSNHVSDWNSGDPTWQGGKGKGLIGAINYLGSKRVNSVYFIPMNVTGDGNDVWPWTGPGERVRFDVSKLDQWNIVFDHMDRKGIMLHIQTQETENETLLDGGNLGRHRKLYFRELIARFGYHHAITWNLGEENDDNTTTQRKAFSDYIGALDPYDHPVVIHTYPGQWGTVYSPLLNYPTFDGASLQVGKAEDTHSVTLEWVNKSAQSGKKWYVTMDEAGPWDEGVSPDGAGNNHTTVRKNVLWANLMAGGSGVEWYFGYNYPNHDLTAEDFRTRDNVWNMTRYAVEFFQQHLPFTEMKSNDGLASNSNAYVLAKEGDVYAVYLKNGGSTNLNISGASKKYDVRWYNPRSGGALVTGTVSEVTGPGNVGIGQPPSQTSQDWVALVGSSGNNGGEGVAGDVSGDGSVTALDASLILQHTSGLISLSTEAQALGDVSNNGDLAAFDASLVLQRVVNLIGCFPAESGCTGKTGTTHKETPQIEWSSWSEEGRNRSISLHVFDEAMERQAAAIDIQFDAQALTLERIEYESPEGWIVSENSEDGRIRLAMAGAPAPLLTNLVTLHFTERSGATITVLNALVSIDEASALSLQAEDATPGQFALEANYPNPFNPSTTIAFSLPETSQVRLEVFDLTGRSVALLVNEHLPAGRHSASFDAANLPSGLYVYRLEAGDFSTTRKMTLVK